MSFANGSLTKSKPSMMLVEDRDEDVRQIVAPFARGWAVKETVETYQ